MTKMNLYIHCWLSNNLIWNIKKGFTHKLADTKPCRFSKAPQLYQDLYISQLSQIIYMYMNLSNVKWFSWFLVQLPTSHIEKQFWFFFVLFICFALFCFCFFLFFFIRVGKSIQLEIILVFLFRNSCIFEMSFDSWECDNVQFTAVDWKPTIKNKTWGWRFGMWSKNIDKHVRTSDSLQQC